MTEATPPEDGYIRNYLQPGMRVWFRTQHMSDKGKLVEKLYGIGGDVTYQGHTTFANAVYLVFDQVEGTGRKAKTKNFAVNAQHCPHIGPCQGH